MDVTSTNNLTMKRELADAILGRMTTGGVSLAPLLNSPSICLWSDPGFDPQPLTATSLFLASEADFSGYARKACTFGGIVNLVPGVRGVVTDVQFIVEEEDPQIAETCYGYFGLDSTGVRFFEKFDITGGINFALPGDFLNLVVGLPMQYVQSADLAN